MAHLREYELTPAQFEVLARVGAAGGLSQQELADRLLVTKGNVCGLIDRMEEAGLVERRPDPEDRRPNRLHLTATGRARFEQVVPAHETLIDELLSAIPDGDLRALQASLHRLDRSLPDE
jgi:DNA-binding MarR family transcriptional regulator